jgi:Uri superfamily endonuclease
LQYIVKKNGEKLFDSGAYAVLFFLLNDCQTYIPRYGNVNFQKGFYVYSGSAKKNLIHRVTRHSKKDKKIKWHIDYFSVLESVQTIKTFLFFDKNECEINSFFYDNGGKSIIKNFGSTDCKRKCFSHFLYFRKRPALKSIKEFGYHNGRLLIL